MNQKILTIILSITLIIVFFLSLVSFFGFSISAFNVVFGDEGAGKDAAKYILLIFPLVGILLLAGGSNNEKYPVSRTILSWISLLTIIGLVIYAYIQSSGKDNGRPFIGFFDIAGIGLWLTVLASLSLVLPFAKLKAASLNTEAIQ